MRSTELAVVAALAAALTVTADGGGVPAPKIHEGSLESGVRVVVAPRAKAGAETVAAVVSIPVGYANDAETPGSGAASFAAGFATFELPRWSSIVAGDSTRFFAALPADAVEAGLTELAKRLVADGVVEEPFNKYVEQRKVAPAGVVDRLREAAFPTTRDGGAIADATKRTRDQLKAFLTERVGSEGAVVSLVGPGTAAELELAAQRAFAGLPRARRVGPSDEREAMPLHARRVDAPSGTTGGEAGVRLPWRADERGDLVALAVAWLEGRVGGAATHVVATRQGTLVGFAGEAADLPALVSALDGARAAAEAIDAGQFATALDRIVQHADETAADPARLAAELAAGATLCSDPLAAFGRADRLRADAAEATRRLKELIRASSRVDVLPPTARPAGT